MKEKIFILPLILGPMSATALDLNIYYDTTGNCDTFCNVKHTGTGCCPSENVIDGAAIAEKFMSLANERDESFSGFTFSDGTTFMDSTGSLKMTGSQVNNKGLGGSVTLRTNNACAGVYSGKNPNGVCVNSNGESGYDYVYIDWNALMSEMNGEVSPNNLTGGEIGPNDIIDNSKGGDGSDCHWDRDFDIVFHWVPKNYGAVDYTYQEGGAHIAYGANPVDWSALPPYKENGDFTLHYHWNGGTSRGVYTQKGTNTVVKEIEFPTVPGWSGRGFYILGYPEYKPNNSSFNNIPYYSQLKTFADNLVTEKTTSWGRARLGLPVNIRNKVCKYGATENGKIDLEDGWGSDGNPCAWANTRWQIWTCDKNGIDTIHMYAAWARDCNEGNGATCMRQIQRHGLTPSADKGDTIYTTSCQNSSNIPTNNNAYNPSCGACSKTNPTMCTKEECGSLTNAHWCIVQGSPMCSSRNSAYSSKQCCIDALDNCDSKGCALMDGEWNGTSCVASQNGGNGDGVMTSCPSAPSNWSQYGTVTRTVGTNSCTYTLNCNNDFNLYNGDNQISKPKTITCNGNDCTDAWLSNQLSNYSCWYNCPPVSQIESWDANMLLGEPVHTSPSICSYEMTCINNLALYQISSIGGTVLLGDHFDIVCNNSDCVSSLSQASSKYSCRVHCPGKDELNNELAGEGGLTVTGVLPWAYNYESCKIDLGCLDNYTLYSEFVTPGFNCTSGPSCALASVISTIKSSFRCIAQDNQ